MERRLLPKTAFRSSQGSGHASPSFLHDGHQPDDHTQMLSSSSMGTVSGIDRRGHGRSTQVSDGHDVDRYAADAAAVVKHLTCATPFISVTPPAGAKPFVTSYVLVGSGREVGAGSRRSTDHGEVALTTGRPIDRGARWASQGLGGEPRAVLSRVRVHSLLRV